MSNLVRLHRPDLVVDDPWELVRRFFSVDRSSIASTSYDGYIAAGKSPANRIVAEDIVAINTTMSARAPHADWAGLTAQKRLPALAAVDPSWDLFLTSQKIWSSERVPERLTALFAAVLRKGVGISRATKVLHMKRPHLIPVCDSYVLRLMGIPGEDGTSSVTLIEHLRSQRGELLPLLQDLQMRLQKAGHERTLVRIMDALIWGSHPDTWLQRYRSPGSYGP
jgi:hypothetical protein